MSDMYSVGWEDDHLPLPSQFASPTAPVDLPTWTGQRLDTAKWVDASQGSQCLPVRVVPAAPLNSAARLSPAYHESVEFLKEYVQHPSQFDVEEESDSATIQPATTGSQESTSASSLLDFLTDLANDYVDSQLESVAAGAEAVQEGAESEGSQRTESDASSDNELPEESDESEVKPKGCNLVRHSRKHAGVKPHACEHCDYSARTRSALVVHDRRHTGVKPYACPHENCGYKASQQANVDCHIRRKH